MAKGYEWSIYEVIVHSSVYEEWDTELDHYVMIDYDRKLVSYVYIGDILTYRVMRINCGTYSSYGAATGMLEIIAKNNNTSVINTEVGKKVIIEKTVFA